MHKEEEEARPPPTLLERIEQGDPTLKELAGFGGYSCHRIAAALRKNEAITSFKLSNCQLGHDSDDGCIYLMQALIARRASLKRISLARNFIGFHGAAALAKFIRATQTDPLIYHSLIRLDLLQNCFGDDGATAIADAIADGTKQDKSQTIAEIGFERNRIGNEGLSRISNMLHQNNTLHTLRIGKNAITHEGVVKSLAPALQNNTALRVLDLCGNRHVGDLGAAAIADALSLNQTLETLILTNCSITEKGALRFLRTLYNCTSPLAVLEESNHTLRELLLCQNPVISTSLIGHTTSLRDVTIWNQHGVASARIYKLNCFLTSSHGPRYVHSTGLTIKLIPKLVHKIWRMDKSTDVVYSYIRGMPQILEV
jgi:Ran GTPase-activating protein (RanGAP) involved in mRNA processing and transport